MGWKKPKWVKKVQSGAQNIANKAAAPIHKAGDAIAKATGLDKVEMPKLPPVSLSAPSNKPSVLDRLGDTLAKGAQAVGDFFNETVSGTGNRKPTVKIQGQNPLEQDRDMKQPMKDFGPTPGEKKAFEGLTPILQNTPIDNVSIPVIDNIRKALASGGSGTLAIPEGGEEPIIVPKGGTNPDKVAGLGDAIDPATWQRIKDNYKKAKDVVVEAGKTAGGAIKDTLIEGIDSMDVKIFRTRFPNAHPTEVEAYRRAYSAGDKKEMDRLTTLMESKQKTGSK